MRTLKHIPDADYCDDNIVVYDVDNGKYFVRDSKETIQFVCTRETLLDYSFTNDDSFVDDFLYDKLNQQNHMELEGKKDSYYLQCLMVELERIVNHCSYNYPEFQDDYQIPIPKIVPASPEKTIDKVVILKSSIPKMSFDTKPEHEIYKEYIEENLFDFFWVGNLKLYENLHKAVGHQENVKESLQKYFSFDFVNKIESEMFAEGWDIAPDRFLFYDTLINRMFDRFKKNEYDVPKPSLLMTGQDDLIYNGKVVQEFKPFIIEDDIEKKS
jgi:hypothetical protein